MTMKRVLGIIALLLPTAAYAVQPDEILPDANLEERARALSAGLRCLVCQNQSIDDSDAPLAHDLRVLVRERLKAGDSDEQVTDFVVARYGEYVLLKPPFAWHTLPLWLLPLLLLGGGVYAARQVFKSAAEPAAGGPMPATLDAEEEAKLKKILGEKL